MVKKTMMGEAADAVKSVAGAALGAAAAAATGVVVGTLAGAITRGGRKLGEAAPVLEKAAADKVSKPMLPTPKKRGAAKRRSTMAKKKVAAIRAAKTKHTAKRRKKR